MRLPNGYGGVSKLSGKRRKPWMARITKGWIIVDGKARQQYETIGYFPTKKEALHALDLYHTTPERLREGITFEECYQKWSSDRYKELSDSAIKNYKAAFKRSETLYKCNMRDLHVEELETCLRLSQTPVQAKFTRILFTQMWKYAMKYEYVDKDYAALTETVTIEAKKTKTIFTQEEIKWLWEHVEMDGVDLILIQLYTGMRPGELRTISKIEDGGMVGGLKTKAGIDRFIPIHPRIRPLIEYRMLYKAESDTENLLAVGSASDYSRTFSYVMKQMNSEHTPHECRHTFITNGQINHMDRLALKKIVGHSVKADVTDGTYTHLTPDFLLSEISKIDYGI